MAPAFDHLAIHPAAYAIGGSNSLGELREIEDAAASLKESVSHAMARAKAPIQHAESPPAANTKFTKRGAKAAKRLTRVAFETSRLMEFCTIRELTNQVGHDVAWWPAVVVKELVDNALDAAEESDIAPAIEIDVSGDTISITDNGPGISDDTVAGVLDYTTRTSNKEVYASPTRGAQGNACKTILAMAFTLNGECGETVIESRGVAHRIIFRVDQILLQPKILHERTPIPFVTGTKITVTLPPPRGYRSIVQNARGYLIEMSAAYCWLNPHASLRFTWDGVEVLNIAATKSDWSKWRPLHPTSVHWYDQSRFERYMAAHVASGKPGRVDTVRAFISEFDRLAATAKQKSILTEVGASHASLSALIGTGDSIHHERIAKLLEAMKRHSKVVAPKRLGIIGRDHLLTRFEAGGGGKKTFRYQLVTRLDENNVPSVIEVAFGVLEKGLNNGGEEYRSREIRGLNWSPAIGDPFRSLGSDGESLGAMLAALKVSRTDPVITFINLVHPRLQYLDRGKSAVAIDD
jgi:Histidine kinase-, DNA gyrase B-, and HSP90-like ATPase